MNEHTHGAENLTKNQALVMAALSASKEPMSAYTILDDLRDDGFRAPLQVYRALEKLLELGLVHRLESLNAFIACNHHGCDRHAAIAFMICDSCGQATEISDSALTRRLKKLAEAQTFALRSSAVELRGICNSCQTSLTTSQGTA